VVRAAAADSSSGARTFDAFEALSDRCLDDAYRLAAVVLRDPIDAQDVVHDAVLLGWRKFGSLRDPARFDGSASPFVRRRMRVDRLPALPLRPLIAEYTATFGSTWAPVTRRKHADDFARLVAWLEGRGLPVTTASLDFMTLVDYVTDLRSRPKVSGVWRGAPDALARSLHVGPVQTLSANSVNAYVRPIRSLAIWLVDEGLLGVNPFRRSRRRAALNPLLPSEETPTKSATLDDLQALERGCAGKGALDLRDAAIVSILVTTAARNSSVRLLRVGDVDFERAALRFRRAKGGKTLELALQPGTATALSAYSSTAEPPSFLPPLPRATIRAGSSSPMRAGRRGHCR
jgi:integrase